MSAATPSRRSELLARLALGMLLVSLVAGMLLPVYTDEFGWRFQERAGIDGGFDIMMNDLCGPGSIARPPWFMMPVRWFSAFANQALASPFYVRLEGVLCALAWVGLLWLLIGRLVRDPARRATLRAGALALLGLGLLPMLMVMSRPEQPLILATILATLFVFVRFAHLGVRRAAWLRVAAILIVATIAASYHIKGVLFAGIALVCMLACAKGRGTWLPRIAGMIALSAMNLTAAHYWITRFRCPGDKALAEGLAGENVAALLASGESPAHILVRVLLGLNPYNYLKLIGPTNTPMAHWIPDGLFPPDLVLPLRLLIALIWAAAIGLAGLHLLRYLAAARLGALREPRVLVGLATLGCMGIWAMSQLNRNVYEAAHMLPMTLLFLLLCVTLPVPRQGRFERWMDGGVRLLVPLSILGQIAMLALLLGPLASAARTPGYIDTQPYSVSVGGYGAVRQDIDRAMALAGMPGDRRLRRVLIDDVTYLHLQGSERPFHRLGVLGRWRGSIEDPAAYLSERGSDGVVVGCHYLPDAMRAVAARSGRICAISASGLERLAAAARAAR